jgi:hypothetical protein
LARATLVLVPDAPYRAPPPVPPDPYVVAWEHLRRRQAWTPIVWIAVFVVFLAAGYFSLWRRTLSVNRVLFAVNLAQIARYMLGPSSRFRCPHCGNKGNVHKKCRRCGIAIGTPKSAIDEAEKRRPAGAPAERAPQAAGYRIADARVDAGADPANDEADSEAALTRRA